MTIVTIAAARYIGFADYYLPYDVTPAEFIADISSNHPRDTEYKLLGFKRDDEKVWRDANWQCDYDAALSTFIRGDE